jgi:hypothetical protein
MFVNDAPPLEEWLLARFSDPDDAYLMALAREYRADYLVTGDHGLLEMSDLFASSTLDSGLHSADRALGREEDSLYGGCYAPNVGVTEFSEVGLSCALRSSPA